MDKAKQDGFDIFVISIPMSREDISGIEVLTSIDGSTQQSVSTMAREVLSWMASEETVN